MECIRNRSLHVNREQGHLATGALPLLRLADRPVCIQMSTGIHFNSVSLPAPLTPFSPRVPRIHLCSRALCPAALCHKAVRDPFDQSAGAAQAGFAQQLSPTAELWALPACRSSPALPCWWHIAAGQLQQRFTARAIRKCDGYFCVVSSSLCRLLPLHTDRL